MAAAHVLRFAEVAVTVVSPISCDVAMTLRVDGGGEIDHRLESPPGTEIDALRVDAAPAAAPRAIGRTQSLVIGPVEGSYRVSYRVRQTHARTSRCPLWLPTAPGDGVSRAVTITVTLPHGATPGSTMPRFAWNGTVGTATLGHLPAFVLVPYAAPGEEVGWDVVTTMDAAAVAVFVAASAIWVWRRRVTSRRLRRAEH